MATIIEHLVTGNEYILLGVGLGIDPGNLSTRFLKTFLPNKVAVCDRSGQLFWLPSSEVIVVEIDGQKPTELLPEPEKVTAEARERPDFAPDLLADLPTDRPKDSPAVNSLNDLELDDLEDEGEWL
jgi:hypothetical protein